MSKHRMKNWFLLSSSCERSVLLVIRQNPPYFCSSVLSLCTPSGDCHRLPVFYLREKRKRDTKRWRITGLPAPLSPPSPFLPLLLSTSEPACRMIWNETTVWCTIPPFSAWLLSWEKTLLVPMVLVLVFSTKSHIGHGPISFSSQCYLLRHQVLLISPLLSISGHRGCKTTQIIQKQLEQPPKMMSQAISISGYALLEHWDRKSTRLNSSHL